MNDLPDREQSTRCDIAVVVPAYNEAESLPELIDRIEAAITGMGKTWEAWIIDDGSTDNTFGVIEELAAARPQVHGLSFGRNFGKAAALAAGFKAVSADLIITMDADLQDDPAEIPAFAELIDQGYDLVSGWKQDRKDSFVKNKTSKVFNWFTSRMCGLSLHDFNCGLKAYRRSVTQKVRLYGDMHRYVPALAHLDGFKVTEMPVKHFARKYGTTKYGMDRFVNGFMDLLTVYFLHARHTSPLHFFGRMGLVSLTIGGGISSWFLVRWMLGYGMHVRPILVLGLVLIVVAFQFISLGLIAELIVAGRRPEEAYRIARRV
ncbi:MAG: glycosyltransferase family 2 protein [Candidatus Krumholzibacteria bacterium]|nr:glycosyltransferase family 2 protein [Candidatus Krumholzibacteria bacterium]